MKNKCKTCNGTGKLSKCERCGVEFRHIHKYSDCDSVGCDGERHKEVDCRECDGSDTAKLPEYQI